MKKVDDISLQENSMHCYLATSSGGALVFYCVILFFTITGLILLPFLYININLRVPGIIRPSKERTEIRALVSGSIKKIYIQEGDIINTGDTILVLTDEIEPSRQAMLRAEINRTLAYIHDLRLLTAPGANTGIPADSLITPLYQAQYRRLLGEMASLSADVQRSGELLHTHASLAAEKITSENEYRDLQHGFQKAIATRQISILQQISYWKQELSEHEAAIERSREEMNRSRVNAAGLVIKSPVKGVVQGIQGWYAGSYLQASAILCTVSPGDTLVGECLLTGNEVTGVYPGQQVALRFNTYGHHLTGSFSGKVISVDDDYTFINNQAVIKVYCSFPPELAVLNHHSGNLLRKGLLFQARFHLARRSLWQVLYKKGRDYLNPVHTNRRVTKK